MTSQAVAPVLKMLLAQTRSELLMRWRVPAFSVTNLVLPIVFFTFFGLPVAHLRRGDGVSIGAYLLASFGAYAVGNVMVYGFGIGVANERGMKIDRLMRASPLPPLVFMLAKVLTALVFSLVALVLLIAFGIVVGGIHETPAVWATIITRLLAGSLPFIALGFAIGYWSGPNAAPALANLIYLPLSFASGLFVPLNQLPAFIQNLAPYLPNYHYAQLAWSALGAGRESLGESLLWLAAYTALFLTLAVRSYRREERAKFA
ncbi:MAG: ABC transporter permease [Candidatus Rokuibacteriota bacterium]|nr:MAG: ABC transporter permease [Candidatus Rokubacteria bacterium]